MRKVEDILSSITGFRKWLEGRKEPFAASARFLLERARTIDGEIHAFARTDSDSALKRAADIESKKGKGRLFGVPVATKDNLCVKGELTTGASHVLDGFRPPYNATVVEKLLAEGAFLMSGANMDEFAFGSSCETSFYGPTRNPWDLERIPGGSSGGSAASVASGQVVGALGSDTGGSIRQPASLCGLVGMKPTYGRVSRYGLLAFASSLDQIGPITRNVSDCAAILGVISGYDPMDSTSVNAPVPNYEESLFKDITRMKIGIPAEYFADGIEKGVRIGLEEAIKVLKKLGAETVDISLPHTKYAVSCYYIVGPAEASSNLARYDGAHYGYRSPGATDMIDMYTETRNKGFGEEAKRRILLGTYALSSGYYEAYYLRAQKVRTKISEDFKKAFSLCDCILTPTSPTTAFKIGEKMDDPLMMYLSDIFTIPANLAGLPAVSVPCGLDGKGLPIGMQLMAKPFAEETLIKVAHAFERETEHHKAFAGNQ